MMSHPGAIIQARMNSARLPGKVLAELCGRTVLEHIIGRLRHVRRIGKIVVATSRLEQDDPIAQASSKAGVPCFRGSLEDVLDRFLQAAEEHGMNHVIRVTGDNPVIDPELVKSLVQFYEEKKLDYASAKDPQSFPPGTACEIVSLDTLRRVASLTSAEEDREHVTWYIVQHPEQFRVAFLPAPERGRPFIRLALDEERDLRVLREVFGRLYDRNPQFGIQSIYELYEREPWIFELNREVVPRNPEVTQR